MALRVDHGGVVATDGAPTPPTVPAPPPAPAPTEAPASRTARLREQAERMREKATAAQEKVEASRSDVPGLDATFEILYRERSVAGSLLACAIAYRVFLWLLPFCLFLAAVLGFVEASGDGESARFGGDIGLEGSLLTSVSDAAEQAQRSRWVLLVLSLWGMYTTSAAATKALVVVHQLAWGMPREKPKGGPVAAGAFLAGALVTLTAMVVSGYLRREASGIGLLVGFAIGLINAVLWVIASHRLPHRDAPWPRLIPGALLFGVGTQLIHGFVVLLLVDRIERASELYGGLGIAAVTLLGLYLFARLIVLAAVVDVVLWERSGHAPAPEAL